MNGQQDDSEEECLLQSDDGSSLNSVTVSLLSPPTCSPTISTNSNLNQYNKKLTTICILMTVVLERAAYYGLIGNLAYFANIILKFSPVESVTVTLVFSGMTWFSCFIGGICGDSLFGRFKTICAGLMCYLFGYASLTLLAFLQKQKLGFGSNLYYTLWFVCNLFVISLGEGCFKANISPFGADQIDVTTEHDIRKYFNYFYWSINVGSFIGFSAIAYIQQYYEFFIGYLIPSCLLGLSLLLFLMPRRRNYNVTSPKHNVLRVLKICCMAMRKKRMQNTYETFKPMRSRLDRAKIKYGGEFLDKDVNDVKILISLLPTLGFLIIYCSCYYQMNSVFLLQGIHLDITIFDGGVIPVAWFQLLNVVFVLLFVPIIDKFVYPAMDRYFKNTPYLFRISIGMLLASMAMVAAGVVEMYRLKKLNNSGTTNNCTNLLNSHHMKVLCTPMSIWYQIPQYFCLGISEIFVLITGLEFAYCQSPRSMQSIVTSLFFVSNGFGSLLTTVIISIGNALDLHLVQSYQKQVHHKVTPNMHGHLDRFFFFMAVLNFVNLIGFVWYSKRQYDKTDKRKKKGTPPRFDSRQT